MSSTEKKKKKREKNRLAQQAYIQKEWERGRLMKENKTGEFYSETYTLELEKRLIESLYKYLTSCTSNNDFLHNFLTLKNHIRDLLIWWNPNVIKGLNYNFLRLCLETYWDSGNRVLLYSKIKELWNNLMPL